MGNLIHEGTLLDENITYTLREIVEISNIEETVIVEMIEHGIIEPQGQSLPQWVFISSDLIRFKKAIRMHRDLNINWEGISLALNLMDELNELRQMVSLLKKHQT